MLVRLGRNEAARSLLAPLPSSSVRTEPIFALSQANTESLHTLQIVGLDELARLRAQEIRGIAEAEMRRGNRAPLVRQAMIRAEIALGRTEVASALLEEWRQENERGSSAQSRLMDFTWRAATLYALLGRADEAVALLRELQREGFHFGFELRVHPEVAPIRNDPRFLEIVREEEAWAKAQPDPIDP